MGDAIVAIAKGIAVGLAISFVAVPVGIVGFVGVMKLTLWLCGLIWGPVF